jgi:hypothetical protein
MEDAQGAYSHEREAKGQNINVGNSKTKSNGHRSRVEPIEMVEIEKYENGSVEIYT